MPLERIKLLTLAIEDAAGKDDWEGVRALLAERSAVIDSVPALRSQDLDELQALESRVESGLRAKAIGVRTKMRELRRGMSSSRAFAASSAGEIPAKRIDCQG